MKDAKDIERMENLPEITNIHAYTYKLIWRIYRKLLIALLAIFIVLVFSPVPLVYIAMIYVAILGVTYGILYKKAYTLFMQEFGKRHGMEYTPSMPLSEVRGRLFSYGHSKKKFKAF